MTEEKNINVKEDEDRPEKIMGAFLSRILHLENLINHILSQHFCTGDDERGTLFFYSITPQTSLRKRIDIFMNMLKIYYNDIYEIHKSDLMKLYEIEQYRNDLAHLVVKSSEQDQNKKDADGEQFLKFKNRKSIMRETMKKEDESKVKICAKLMTVLKIIQRDIIIRGYNAELSDNAS